MEGLARDHTTSRPRSIHRGVTECRVCGGDLKTVVDLGRPALGSRFPAEGESDAPKAPLTVCRCWGCGLVQLGQTVDPDEIWRPGYGYQSGVNEMMRRHLAGIVDSLALYTKHGDTVIDIGCNDGTLLRSWGALRDINRIGFDPLAQPVEGATIVTDYFTADDLGIFKAKIVTSIAMFYDLDDPVRFARDVAAVLAPDGIWCLEVGYVGALIDGAWDGICHEHLEYYGLVQIKAIAAAAGLKVARVSFNEVNGGSMQCWLVHEASRMECDLDRQWLVEAKEADFRFDTLERDIGLDCKALRRCLKEFADAGKTIYALGASTKGNTLLQAAGISRDLVRAAVDRNPDKIGRRLPGNGIPIIGEAEARAAPPDAFLVLPWHFRAQLLEREKALRETGTKFIFPLPRLEVV